jgi:hypothetical protein
LLDYSTTSDQNNQRRYAHCVGLRRKFVIGLTLALTLTALPAHAALVPKAGATCSKTGQTITHKAKKYTCIKKGRVLVWSKGVAAKKTSSPKPSPSPSVAPPPMTTAPAPIWAASYQRAQQHLTSLPKDRVSGLFDITLSPTVNRQLAEQTVQRYEEAMRFWAPFLGTTKIRWVLMSESDHAWWKSTVLQIEGPNGDTNVWNSNSNELGHCYVRDTSFCGYGTTAKVNEQSQFFQYNLIGSRSSPNLEARTVNHEAVHFYQFSFGALGYPKPNWLVEGQANFFMNALSSNSASNWNRSEHMQRLLSIVPEARTYTPEQWRSLLRTMDEGSQYGNTYLRYEVGLLAFELIYTRYTLQQMHDVMKQMAGGSTWEQAVRDVLAADADELQTAIVEYLASQSW